MSVTEWTGLVLGGLTAVDDVRCQGLANAICAGGLAAGLACGVWRSGWHGLGLAAAGAAASFLVFYLLHRLGVSGLGDAKLMTAFGSLLGPPGALLAVLIAVSSGGLLALGGLLDRPRTAAIPLAPPIVAAALVVIWGRC